MGIIVRNGREYRAVLRVEESHRNSAASVRPDASRPSELLVHGTVPIVEQSALELGAKRYECHHGSSEPDPEDNNPNDRRSNRR